MTKTKCGVLEKKEKKVVVYSELKVVMPSSTGAVVYVPKKYRGKKAKIEVFE